MGTTKFLVDRLLLTFFKLDDPVRPGAQAKVRR
jgi:hypothetical protein